MYALAIMTIIHILFGDGVRYRMHRLNYAMEIFAVAHTVDAVNKWIAMPAMSMEITLTVLVIDCIRHVLSPGKNVVPSCGLHERLAVRGGRFLACTGGDDHGG